MEQGFQLIRPDLLNISIDQLKALAPFLIVLGGAALSMVTAVAQIDFLKRTIPTLAVLTCIGVVAASILGLTEPATLLFNNMFSVDGYSAFFNVLILAIAGLTVLASTRYLEQESIAYPEYYILILFSALGMMVMCASLDLMSIFIGLETMSLSVYTLVGFRRADRRSNEASLKYFVLGGVASAVLLYGVALLYGASGSTNLTAISAAVKGGGAPLVWTGAWGVMAGFLFKVAAGPFHMGMADV